MEDLQHECGVVALYHLDGPDVSPLVPGGNPLNTAHLIPRMLVDLQNRGQLAAGMSSFHAGRDQLIETYREIGTVIEAFRLNRPDKFPGIQAGLAGTAAVGHVRYATCGANTRAYAQPFERKHGRTWKWFAFAFNGQLANYAELRDELKAGSAYHLTRDTDTEVIMHSIARELRGEHPPDLADVFGHLGRHFDGAYNLVYLDATGAMVVLRDPLGVRPLCWARQGPLFGAASESVALANLGFREVYNLEPGEMLIVRGSEVRKVRYAERRPPPTASSSGLTSPTWPARSTTGASTWPGRRSGGSWPSRSGGSAGCRSTPARSWCRCRTRPRPRPTPWPTPSACRAWRG